MTEVLKAGVLSDEIDLGALAHNAAEQAEEFVRKVIKTKTVILFKLLQKILFARFGKLAGKYVTIKNFQNGCRTMIFYIEDIVHRYHRSVHVSSQFSACTQKLETSGHIYLVV